MPKSESKIKKTTEKEKKPKAKKVVGKKKAKKKPEKEVKKEIVSGKYLETVGKRKTSVARVRLWTKGDAEFLVNGKAIDKYFPALQLQKTALASLEAMKYTDKFKIHVLVRGGGIYSQAEAIRHGLARALVLFNADFRKKLKKAGFLRRDSRMRERKKFGLKRARRAPQWGKR